MLTPADYSSTGSRTFGRGQRAIARALDRARAGDIVLLHDGAPRATATAAALRAYLARHDRPPAVAVQS